jgi:uncharacterized repeat protein (TIGR03803 family)
LSWDGDTLMRRTARPSAGWALAAATAALLTAGALAPPAAGAAAATERVLYSFTGPNGAGPLFSLVNGPGGVLFGTTAFGGSHGNGTAFSLTPHGSGYTGKVLFSFGGAAGSRPEGVVAGAYGDLFGDTVIGGASGNGTVFELVRGSSGGYTEKVLHSFSGGGGDGLQPVGAPVMDPRGDVFGVTQFGGSGGQGVLYEMRHSAAGYTEKVVHAFASTGGQPQAGLAIGSDGSLYGTLYGFSQVNPGGTVFRVRPGRSGAAYAQLYAFTGGADGANPFGA